jgi:hypothetical protein
MLRISCLLVALWTASSAAANGPLRVRIENFTVLPSSQPVLAVQIQNPTQRPFTGQVTAQLPDKWRIAPTEQPLTVQPGQLQRVTFSVQRGVDQPDNTYRLAVVLEGQQRKQVHQQQVHVASTPYFKPTIDGELADWKAAIPLTFTTGGRRTTVSTYWNRRAFSLLVAVSEDRWIPRNPGSSDQSSFDAVQFALASRDAQTGSQPQDEAERFEFLLVADASGEGQCLQLAQPGMPLAKSAESRSLDDLPQQRAELVVRRGDGVTYYECRLPWGSMRRVIRPSEGRSYRFSLLVHDPDGTGIRDLGQAVELWESQRSTLAWSRWAGAQWGQKPPLDSKVEWGFCSSRY